MLSLLAYGAGARLSSHVCRGTMRAMARTDKENETTVLYVRGTPRVLARKLRAAAALEGKRLPGYVMEVLQAHVTELERKGLLPRSK